MGHRSQNDSALAREVLSAFHRLPQCPRALTATADATASNIILELHGRTFTVSALVIDRTIATPGWCENVLKLVLGTSGRRVEEVRRRAEISAGLNRAELETMVVLSRAGVLRWEARPDLVGTLNRLVEKDLVRIAETSRSPLYMLTAAGVDALAAHA